MIPKIINSLFEKRNRIVNSLGLKTGDVCIDCGANVGYVTEKMTRKGCVVYAFEPNPYAYKILENKFG